MQDSPLWPYPETGERGRRSARSTPVVPGAAAGHAGALLPREVTGACKGREQGGTQCCSSAFSQAAGVGSEGETGQRGRDAVSALDVQPCGDPLGRAARGRSLLGGMLRLSAPIPRAAACPAIPQVHPSIHRRLFGVLQLPGRRSLPSSSLCFVLFCFFNWSFV